MLRLEFQRLAVSELRNEPQDVGLKLRIADAVIAADERHDLPPIEGLVDVGCGVVREIVGDEPVRIAFEEKGRRDRPFDETRLQKPQRLKPVRLPSSA